MQSRTPTNPYGILGLGRSMYAVTNGSFFAPFLLAIFAVIESTPDNSNLTDPGRTIVAQYFTEPAPPPIRTSLGFPVTGRCGNARIHSFP